MTLTLSESAHMTHVMDDGRSIGMVQQDPYGSSRWLSWRPNWSAPNGYEPVGEHGTREAALAEFGWVDR